MARTRPSSDGLNPGSILPSALRRTRNGRLVQVLPQYYTPDADIHAVYPQRHQLAARVRAFVDFVALSFSQQAGTGKP